MIVNKFFGKQINMYVQNVKIQHLVLNKYMILQIASVLQKIIANLKI